MAMHHIVEQGEYLSLIAKKYGFSTYRTLWNHPENADLKKLRKNPNILFPGDRVFIPDRQEHSESKPTDQKHSFTKQSDKILLRKEVKDENDEAVRNTPCKLFIGIAEHADKTNGSGIIEIAGPLGPKGSLTIKGIEMPLLIGHLDPVQERSGQVARLNNLGYRAGSADAPDENAFKSALEEFQCDHPPLKVDGVCGEKTQAKLVEIHGC
jgi:hypothetical protein